MREIKFRAWDKKEKAMVGWNVITQTAFNRGENESTLMYRILTNHADIFHVMQFTGLKDKNGTEIYEGDIVRAATEEIGDNFQMTGRFYDEDVQKVYWDDEAAGWFLSENRYKQVQPMAHRERFEVIGNIYETPELLQEVEKGMKENKNA